MMISNVILELIPFIIFFIFFDLFFCFIIIIMRAGISGGGADYPDVPIII